MSSFASVSTLKDSVKLPFTASKILRIQDPGLFTLELSSALKFKRRKVIDKVTCISCTFCKTVLLNGISSCNQLPSQYFNEVLECYYCHNEAYPFQPPATFTPKSGTVLQNQSHVITLVEDCSNIVRIFLHMHITTGSTIEDALLK